MNEEEKKSVLTALWLVLGILLMGMLIHPVQAQNCRRHDCSDDTVGVYGNEFITHDPAPVWATRSTEITPETTRCYEYALWDILLDAYTHLQQNCDGYLTDDEGVRRYLPPRPGFNPYAVPGFHPVEYIRYTFAMRSCIGHGTPEERCGPWQPFVTPGDPESGPDYIELIGGIYQCFGTDLNGRCIKQCYPSGSMPLYGLIRECEG